MVETKYTSKKIQKRGSKELVAALPSGMLQVIFKHFGKTYPWTFNVLSGKRWADNGMCECAMRIISFHKEVKYDEKINEILNDYGKSN